MFFRVLTLQEDSIDDPLKEYTFPITQSAGLQCRSSQEPADGLPYRSPQPQHGLLVRCMARRGRPRVQIVNSYVQPRRKSAAVTASGMPPEFTSTSALDQLGRLVQNRPRSADATLARFKQTVVPQLDAAYNFARFLSRDADAAQDIVQEAFLRAYRNFAGYRGGDARAWIFTIVRNCYHGWLMDRRRKSRLEVDCQGEGISEELISNISSDEDNPEATLVRRAESQTVRLVLNTMPRPLREILVLREIEELSYHQISEITSVPIGTVMSRLARARRAFAIAWEREAPNGG
jgi:RNA polymerase sigma factor (sigma-70 family)